jgi:type IV pilus assembly protein PilF
MSKHSNPVLRALLRAWPLCGVAAALLLAACAGHTAKQADKSHEAAIYNVQLGVAYMNQGDLERAKEKLERAYSQDPNSADVRSARAALFARLGEKEKADSEYRAASHHRIPVWLTTTRSTCARTGAWMTA